jgi:uncharacterized membrane protein
VFRSTEKQRKGEVNPFPNQQSLKLEKHQNSNVLNGKRQKSINVHVKHQNRFGLKTEKDGRSMRKKAPVRKEED